MDPLYKGQQAEAVLRRQMERVLPTIKEKKKFNILPVGSTSCRH